MRRLVSLAVATATIAGCKGTDSSGSAGTGDIGGTIVLAVAADATTLLPPLISGITDREASDLLYDRLAEIGPDLNTAGDKGFVPQLAERWEWSADSLSIAFHINPHAKWHDGQPVRASDVKFSVALNKDPALGSPALSLMTNIDSISVRDSLTAVAFFKQRTPEQFFDLVYQIAILPEHILANTPVAQLKTAEVGRRGIGSGRFRLAKWEPGARIELIADTANYRGRPKLDRVVFSVAPDFSGAAARFFAGDADLLENIKADHVAKLVGDTARQILRLPNLSYNYFAMNAIDPKAPGQPHPIFGEKAVRRALSMAVDRRAMLKNVFDTIGQIAYGPFPHSMSVTDTTLPQILYDTTKAKALLDSAGWVVGPDGIRSKNGRRLEFSVSSPSSSAFRHQYVVLMQDAFRRVGASAKLDESDFPSYLAKLSSHQFDAEMENFNMDPSVTGFKQSWASQAITNGQNHISYANPAVDALLDSASNAFDPARRKSYTRRALETIMDDAPGIWLYETPSIAGISKRIHVTHLRADAYFADMADWYIPAGQRNARDKIGLRPAP